MFLPMYGCILLLSSCAYDRPTPGGVKVGSARANPFWGGVDGDDGEGN